MIPGGGSGEEARIRAFVALDLDPASLDLVLRVTAALQASAPPGGHLRWTSPEQLHVTVKFLGSVSAAVLGAIEAEVRAFGGREPALRVTLRSIRGFSSLTRATVLVGALEEESGALASLARRFEERAVALGAPAETRAYRPHLTLARLRAPRNLRPWIDGLPFSPLALRLASLALYRSDLGPSGAKYTPLVRVALG